MAAHECSNYHNNIRKLQVSLIMVTLVVVQFVKQLVVNNLRCSISSELVNTRVLHVS